MVEVFGWFLYGTKMVSRILLLGEVCRAFAVLVVVQLCLTTTAEDKSEKARKKEQERERL